MSKTYSAGIATAYGAAKQGGYQGSYTDFCNDIAQLGDITEELGSISATATTLEAGSSATASYNEGAFSFGIPRGNTGAQGERGETGATGATGNGIASIAKTGTSGLVDTYTITFTDGTTTTFDVTNGAEAIDDTLSIAGRAADAKATGDAVNGLKSDLSEITEYAYGKNRFDSSNCVDGYVLLEDGQPYPTSGWSISNYCYVKGFSQIFGSALNANNIRKAFSLAYICSYDSNKEFIERISTMALNPVSIDNDVAYVRFCLQNTNLDKDVMLEGGSSFTAYEPYSKTLVSKTDKTLTSNLLPANAKAVGENIGKVKDQLSYSAVNFTLIDSKFLNGDTGAITDASGTNNKVSNYIEIVPNSKIMITTEHFWSQGLYAFYDEDNNFISGKKSNSGGTVTQIYNEIVKTPINAKYLVIGFLYQASMPEPFVFQGVTQDANPSSIWADKKWTVVGDSLTAYNDKTSMHYFDYIAGATGINIHNMGVSGSGYAKLDNNFRTRVLDVPTDSDIVTIFGSGNDASSGLDLGTATDTGTETLGGVINTTIDNLYSIMPIVNLGIVTPTPWQGNMPYDNGWMENYSNMIVEICRRRSIPCLDLFHCSNLNPNSEQVRQLAYSKDKGGGVHPNELGHKIIASRFKGFLETLLM